jgi:hypothetical protein
MLPSNVCNIEQLPIINEWYVVPSDITGEYEKLKAVYLERHPEFDIESAHRQCIFAYFASDLDSENPHIINGIKYCSIKVYM